MPTVFNADEIFEIAQQLERNGANFYRRAAENNADERVRKMLLQLASMEVRHEKIFSDMREQMSKRTTLPPVFDPEGEAAQYLRAAASGHVFDVKSDPSKQLSGRETLVEVLQKAIGLEKDSVVFYEGIKEVVPKELGGARVEEIIREEMSHITVLSRELAAVTCQ